MLVTIEKCTDGVLRYIENEVIAKISGWQQIALGVAVAYKTRNIYDTVNKIKSNKTVQTLGLINDDGTVDVNILKECVIETVRKHANGRIEIDGGSLLGAFAFNEDDLTQLFNYVTSAET